jgi:hypothetical protein
MSSSSTTVCSFRMNVTFSDLRPSCLFRPLTVMLFYILYMSALFNTKIRGRHHALRLSPGIVYAATSHDDFDIGVFSLYRMC